MSELEEAQQKIKALKVAAYQARVAMNALGNALNWEQVPQSYVEAMNAIWNRYDTGVLSEADWNELAGEAR